MASNTGGQDPLVGQLLDSRWEVVRSLNVKDGNFGDVYEGLDRLSNDAPCAIKALKSTRTRSSDLLDFETEGDLLELLAGCSNVITILDRGTQQIQLQAPQPTGPPVPWPVDVPYIVLERADASLLDLLVHRDQLPWSDRLGLFRDVVKGMHQMHLNRVLNRDLKSSNALIFRDSPKINVAKISDLGRSTNTRTPPRVSTDQYAFMRGDPSFGAPELIWGLGNLDPDSGRLADLYLLGSLLFEFAAGQGLTAMAIPDPVRVMRAMGPMPEADRLRLYKANGSQIQARLELGYALFESEVPAAIKDRAMALFRLLTSVEPAKREPTSRSGRALATPWDLQWLIHRVDVMLKALAIKEQDDEERQEKKRRQAVRAARRVQANSQRGRTE